MPQAPLKHGNAGGTSTAAELDALPSVQFGVRFSLKPARPVPCGLAVLTPRPMTVSSTRATPCCACSTCGPPRAGRAHGGLISPVRPGRFHHCAAEDRPDPEPNQLAHDPGCTALPRPPARVDVHAVGYGSDAGTNHRKVKNSWGTLGGEHGYVRLHRSKHLLAGECGIPSGSPSSLVVSGVWCLIAMWSEVPSRSRRMLDVACCTRKEAQKEVTASKKKLGSVKKAHRTDEEWRKHFSPRLASPSGSAAVDRHGPGRVHAPHRPTGTENGQGWVCVRVEHGEVPGEPTSQEPGARYYGLGDEGSVSEVGGSRPDWLFPVSGPQERVQRHTEEQIITSVSVPMLDASVPLVVEQPVDVLKIIDAMLPDVEQVIEVPKIILLEQVPKRATPCDPLLVEQLVSALRSMGTCRATPGGKPPQASPATDWASARRWASRSPHSSPAASCAALQCPPWLTTSATPSASRTSSTWQNTMCALMLPSSRRSRPTRLSFFWDSLTKPWLSVNFPGATSTLEWKRPCRISPPLPLGTLEASPGRCRWGRRAPPGPEVPVPVSVILARGRDAAGVEWCQVAGRRGDYRWQWGTRRVNC